MTTYIARNIMRSRDISLNKGQDKYRTYFTKTKLYKKYQADVDNVLQTTERTDEATYEDCIVAE